MLRAKTVEGSWGSLTVWAEPLWEAVGIEAQADSVNRYGVEWGRPKADSFGIPNYLTLADARALAEAILTAVKAIEDGETDE